MMLRTLALALVPTLAQAQNNVLLVVADDVGVDKIGVYAEGTMIPPTPNIDSLAATGVLFRNAWSNPVSSTTRATMLTGRYSFRTGVGYLSLPSEGELPLSEYIIPELLDTIGTSSWSHAAIGKWHLGNDFVGGLLAPNLAGFDHYAGTLTNLDPMTDGYFFWPKTVDGVQSYSTNYITTEEVDEAIAWIGTAQQPWYCQVWFWAAHAPYAMSPPALHTYTLPPIIPHGDISPHYDATVQSMDTELGRLLATIDPSVLANTTIIFTSDNATVAEASYPPFLPSHAKIGVYEGGINVPLIIKGPQVVDPGREEDAVVHTVDLFETAMDIAGVDLATALPAGHKIDSVSLMPYLTSSSAPDQRKMVFSELFYPVLFPNMYATRNVQYKYMRIGPAEQFYDLLADPFEANNLLLGPMSVLEKRNYRMLKAEIATILGS